MENPSLLPQLSAELEGTGFRVDRGCAVGRLARLKQSVCSPRPRRPPLPEVMAAPLNAA